MASDTQFDEEYDDRSNTPEPKRGIINFLVSKGIAKDKQAATYILIGAIVVIVIVTVILLIVGGGNEVPLTAPQPT